MRLQKVSVTARLSILGFSKDVVEKDGTLGN